MGVVSNDMLTIAWSWCVEHYRLFLILGFFLVPILGIKALLVQSDLRVNQALKTHDKARASGVSFAEARARENLNRQSEQSLEGELRRRGTGAAGSGVQVATIE